jgi:hypothetical protein
LHPGWPALATAHPFAWSGTSHRTFDTLQALKDAKDMIDPRTLEQIINTLRAALPQNLAQDAEKNLRAALLSVFERLDLVTREEFDVQSAVLSRTRAKLESLEKQVTELEQKLLKK